ncbi:MAG: hypothetical protein JST41_11670 [Bacteroidetes bacterium]|jgi:predicted transcriptional regulator|nr:hypothetical protein [Bacteroidota bacterium]MCC6654391.1 hypothetical protein [Flavobacteriales bacterium]HMU15280.1 hypothetical protein [Flavobacteriales bacterium]HMW97114.1 hypothetical protein [Flavobacteriales bacterium]
MSTTRRGLSKRAVLKSLKELPERFDADELIERIVLLQKIEEGLSDAKAGRVLTSLTMKAHIDAKWSK